MLPWVLALVAVLVRRLLDIQYNHCKHLYATRTAYPMTSQPPCVCGLHTSLNMLVVAVVVVSVVA